MEDTTIRELLDEIDRYGVLFAGIRDSAEGVMRYAKDVRETAERLRLDTVEVLKLHRGSGE